MTALFAALMLLASPAPERLEAALLIPQPTGVTLSDQVVLHDAARGVTVVPNLRPDAVDALLDGTSGRFVAAGVADLAGRPAVLRLPLGARDLNYIGLRDGRPQNLTVGNPAAVTVEAVPAGKGGRFTLTFTVVQLAAQEPVPPLQNAPVGEPVFSRNRLALEQALPPDQPLLVLLAAGDEVQVNARQLEVTTRNRVGNQVVEAAAPLVGLILRRVPAGGELCFDQLSPPVAAPGQVAVVGNVPRPGPQPFEPGRQASDALQQAGAVLAPGRQVEVTRLEANGAVNRFPNVLPAPGTPDDFALQDRDVLRVGPPRSRAAANAPAATRANPGAVPNAGAAGASPEAPVPKSTPPMAAQRAERAQQETMQAPATAPAPPGAPGGGAVAGATMGMPGAAGPPGPVEQQRATPLLGSMQLDDLQRVAPAAARAAAASVALHARVDRGGAVRDVLLCGTILSADGLIGTAPASTLDGARELTASLPDGRELPCTRAGSAAGGTVLLLRVAANGLPVLANAPLPPPGAPVVVLGHPYGLLRSVTVTVVAGPPRELPELPVAMLQLDGALALGNAGGPIVDLQGRLVGLAYGTLHGDEAGPLFGLAVPAGQIVARAAK